MTDLVTCAHALSDELIALRRRLHQIPEVGLVLPQTQAVLLDELNGLPLELSLGSSLSSITAVLRGGAAPADLADRPVVLLRGDMDALPVIEDTGLDFASTNGAMHACGHDLHMSILMGAVRLLCARQAELTGDVVFMFQPGEEGNDGAGHMLGEGLLDAAGKRPDAAYAIHVFSALEPGSRFASRAGAIMASSDIWSLTMHGRGGHGSTPYLAKDPIPALAEFVTASHAMVTRQFNIFDPVVVTVGRIAGGSAANVIPGQAELDATLRTYDTTTRARLFAELEQLAQGIAAAHGCTAEIEITELYPVTVNTADHVDRVEQAVTELFGAERFTRWANPLAGAEDFSKVLLEVPGAYVALSAVPEGVDHTSSAFNHSPQATFDDAVIADGAALLADLALRTLTPLA